MLEKILCIIAMLLPMEGFYVSPDGPVQGVWLELGRHELTIQRGPGYKAAIMLYGPDRTRLPDALYLDDHGVPRMQESRPI